MELAHIYYKELVTDKENIFTANISQNNQVENIKFSKCDEYGVTGMAIKPDIGSYFLIKVSDKQKLKKISEKIQDSVTKNKELKTDLKLSNSETKDLIIPLTKKNETELPPIKFTYDNTTTQKSEAISFYDYYTHRQKFGFEWENDKIDFKYRIELTISDKFMKKSTTMGRLARGRLNVDESRIWHMDMANTRRLSDSLGFLYDEKHVLYYFEITDSESKSLRYLPAKQKLQFLQYYS